MANTENRDNIPEKHISPAPRTKPVVQEEIEDELTVCEETIAEHVATGVPTESTITGDQLPKPCERDHVEEDYKRDFEESDLT